MSDIDPSELSALLDGELPSARAAQLQAMIAADDRLRTDYQGLQAVDAGWRAMAADAAFPAQVRLPVAARAVPQLWGAVLCLVPIAALAGKLTGAMAPALVLNGLALLMLLGALVAAASPRAHAANPQPT